MVLNKVASERHRRLVEDGMARIGLQVLGAMTRNAELALPERHLGLVQAGETDELGTRLERLANAVESSLDIDRLIALAHPTRLQTTGDARPLPPPGQRIALASDKAFSFVYPHVLSGWRPAGA